MKSIRSSKYNARPTLVGSLRFHSKKEARRYQELKLLEHAGEISGLELQVKYHMYINGQLISTYVADFVYQNKKGQPVIEDCKGFRTPEYRLKKKLMAAIYGITILET